MALRVLILEDELLLAMDAQDKVERLGHEVVALATSVDEAQEYLEHDEQVELGVLDLNLGRGGRGEQVAAMLEEHHVPFIFATAYGREGVPEQFREYPVLSKPYGEDDLQQAIRAAVTEPHDGRYASPPEPGSRNGSDRMPHLGRDLPPFRRE